MTGIRVQNISQFGGGAIADGFLQTAAALSTSLQTVKDNLGNSSALKLSTLQALISNLNATKLGVNTTNNTNTQALIANDTAGQFAAEVINSAVAKAFGIYESLGNAISVGINTPYTTAPTATLDVVGEGSTTATNAIIIKNASGNVLWQVTDGDTSYWHSKLLSSGGEGLQSGGNSTGHLQILPAPIGIRSYMDSASKSFLINTTGGFANEASAFFQLDSTTRGILLPRMTTTQRNAISSPANSLTVFDTDLDTICFYSSAAGGWRQVSNSAA